MCFSGCHRTCRPAMSNNRDSSDWRCSSARRSRRLLCSGVLHEYLAEEARAIAAIATAARSRNLKSQAPKMLKGDRRTHLTVKLVSVSEPKCSADAWGATLHEQVGLDLFSTKARFRVCWESKRLSDVFGCPEAAAQHSQGADSKKEALAFGGSSPCMHQCRSSSMKLSGMSTPSSTAVEDKEGLKARRSSALSAISASRMHMQEIQRYNSQLFEVFQDFAWTVAMTRKNRAESTFCVTHILEVSILR